MTDNILSILAISKAVSPKQYSEASGLIDPGTYPIDIRVRIAGGIKKAKPYTAKVPAAANPWKLLAIAMGKLNAASRRKVVEESLKVGTDDAQVIKEAVEADIREIIATTERTISGAVTGALTFSDL